MSSSEFGKPNLNKKVHFLDNGKVRTTGTWINDTGLTNDLANNDFITIRERDQSGTNRGLRIALKALEISDFVIAPRDDGTVGWFVSVGMTSGKTFNFFREEKSEALDTLQDIIDQYTALAPKL